MIPVVTPEHFQPGQLDELWQARHGDYPDLDICIPRSEHSSYRQLVNQLRHQEISRLTEDNPELEPQTIAAYTKLCQVSQHIVRGNLQTSLWQEVQAASERFAASLVQDGFDLSTLCQIIAAAPIIYDHGATVASIAATIAARGLHKPQADIARLIRAAVFHDIGKSCVSLALLHKPGLFTAAEYEHIKTHTQCGHDEIQAARNAGVPIDAEALTVALEHHEKFQGHGYPRKLAGRREDHERGIHEFARVVMIADVFGALLMKQSYREAFDAAHAIAIMQEDAERDFDPVLWQAFKGLVDEAIEKDEDAHPYVQRLGRVYLPERLRKKSSAS
jgi:HD-GYP domain-containing protein (c-di-GMP phosphodiesterase class II)